jgi:hypothetical protein
VLGAGAARHFSAVRWGIAGNILFAWLMTIPAAGAVAAFMETITRLPGGEVIVLGFAAAIAAGAFAAAGGWFRRRDQSRDVAALVAPPA